MKVRSPLLSLGFSLFAMASAHAQVTWTGLVDGSLNTLLNWNGGNPAAADLTFSATLRPLVSVDSSIAVKSLTFSGLYPSYGFSSPNGSVLSTGSSGITVAAQGSSIVIFDSTLPVQLTASQTWNVDGILNVAGPISSAPASTTILTKTGTGALSLSGNNTYNGGTDLQQGSLTVGSSSVATAGVLTSGPLGTGLLKIGTNTKFGALIPELVLGNDVSLATGATLLSGSNLENGVGLTFAGKVTAATSAVVVTLAGSDPTTFAGLVDGPVGTALTFRSASGTWDGAAFTGSVSPNVASLIADNSALFFANPAALPETVNVGSVNGGYVSVVAPIGQPTMPVMALIDRITSPAAFAGTFGFDTEPGVGPPHIFSDNVDFSAFTDPSFNMGSVTEAVLTGTITPPIVAGAATYRFGSGGGHLFVESNLGDPLNPSTSVAVPAAVVISTTNGSEPEGIVLRGANTFTGTTTVAGVTSNLRVNQAFAIFDSAQALPTSATFSLTDRAYVGYTEAASFSTFADFLSHLATGGYSANSIVGLDSHAFIQNKRDNGDVTKSSGERVFSGVVDLSSTTNIYLGALTRARITGEVRAPSSGVLQLTGVSDGRLAISSNLTATLTSGTANIASVVVGFPVTSADDELGSGVVELTGASTYTGGTTLKSGALVVGNSSTVSGATLVSGPLGTGTLTIASTQPVTLASNTSSGAALYNATVLSSSLQLGLWDPGTLGVDPNRLTLAGAISGTGGLDSYGWVTLSGANSYSGGTYAHRGGIIFVNAAAIPALPLTGAIKSDANAYVGLATPPALLQLSYISRFDPANTLGTIGFDTLTGATNDFSGTISMVGLDQARLGSSTSAKLSGLITPAISTYRFGGGGGVLEVSSALLGLNDVEVASPAGSSLTLRLTGTNLYTGSTTVRNSALIFGAGALPITSAFAMDANGYIGTEDASLDGNFGSFLGHFAANLDRGMIGFDANPSLTSRTITTALDLSRFNSTTPNFYIGTSTSLLFGSAASITLPANATAYRFAGYNGGRLQIDSVLSGAKGLIIGDPLAPLTQVSQGGKVSSVVLNAANTFSGDTTLFAGNVYLGTSTVLGPGIVSGPLGTGTLTVAGNAFSGRPALRVLSAPVTLDNPVVLSSGLDVSSDLTFNGAISGPGSLRKVDAGTTTLAGSNGSWTGGLTINQGGVTLTQDASAGTGKLTLGSTLASIATFLSATPNIGSLSGDNALDQLILAPSSSLTISQKGKTQFMGIISGTGARVALQNLETTSPNQITLGGANTYTGGTTIGPNVTVIAANNNALGTTGTVTLNGGTLAVASGVTTTFNSASHSLAATSGRLSGTGTFAFDASLDVKSGANGAVVLSPGLSKPGLLNLGFTSGATLILNSGGSYNWKLMDAAAVSGGWDKIAVAGGVDVTATALAPFNLSITSVGTDGSSAPATNFDMSSSYSWTLLSATAITGFDPTKFSIDASLFLNQTLDGKFSLALDASGTNLMLNYTAAAIPEPSTWALMITGVAAFAFQSLRRRRK